jgi:phage-related minor tail protein
LPFEVQTRDDLVQSADRLRGREEELLALRADMMRLVLDDREFAKWEVSIENVDQAYKDLKISMLDAIFNLQEQQEEAKKTAESLQEIGDTLSSSVLGAIEQVTETGKFVFRDFADSIIRDLLRVLQQQYLQPKMGSWVEAGLKLGLQALGLFAGVNLPAGTTELATASGTSFLTSATGGPLRHGVTLVGEAGPEALVSRGGRGMVFPTSHPLSRAAIRARLPGRQFGGPLPSALLGTTGSLPGEATMTSASGTQRGAVVQNFYIQTPDAASFVKSKGEVQRQMLAAFRSSQRS